MTLLKILILKSVIELATYMGWICKWMKLTCKIINEAMEIVLPNFNQRIFYLHIETIWKHNDAALLSFSWQCDKAWCSILMISLLWGQQRDNLCEGWPRLGWPQAHPLNILLITLTEEGPPWTWLAR